MVGKDGVMPLMMALFSSSLYQWTSSINVISGVCAFPSMTSQNGCWGNAKCICQKKFLCKHKKYACKKYILKALENIKPSWFKNAKTVKNACRAAGDFFVAVPRVATGANRHHGQRPAGPRTLKPDECYLLHLRLTNQNVCTLFSAFGRLGFPVIEGSYILGCQAFCWCSAGSKKMASTRMWWLNAVSVCGQLTVCCYLAV